MSCLTPSTANATSIYYLIQDECGVVPKDPVWKRMRFTGGVPTLSMDPLQSAELDGSPEITAVRLGNRNVAAEESVELYYGAHDDLIEGVMQSTWVEQSPIADASIVIDTTVPAVTILGQDITDKLQVGDIFRLPDMELGANMQPMQVTSIVFSVDTVIGIETAKKTNETLGVVGVENETSTSDINLPKTVSIGTTRQYFSLLVKYGDLSGGVGYDLVTDAEATAFSFNVAVNAMVTGSISFIGKNYGQDVTLPAGSTFEEAENYQPFTGIDGSFAKNGAPLLLSTSADISLDRGATASFQIGSKYMSHVSYSKATNDVSISTFFYNYDLSKGYVSELEGDYSIITSLDGKAMMFRYPTAKITGLEPDVSEGDNAQTLTLMPYKPPGAVSSLIIQTVE